MWLSTKHTPNKVEAIRKKEDVDYWWDQEDESRAEHLTNPRENWADELDNIIKDQHTKYITHGEMDIDED